MQAPELHTVEFINKNRFETHKQLKDGRWVPARPENPFVDLKNRIILSWKVFTGKYDALDWEND